MALIEAERPKATVEITVPKPDGEPTLAEEQAIIDRLGSPAPPSTPPPATTPPPLFNNDPGSTSCSTITDKNHPSFGDCTRGKRGFQNAQDHLKAYHKFAAENATASAIPDRISYLTSIETWMRESAVFFGTAGDYVNQAKATKQADEAKAEATRLKPAPTKADALRKELWEKLSAAAAGGDVGDAATCDASIRPQIKAIDKNIEVLRKEEPKESVGPDVEAGSCGSRLRKLYGNFRAAYPTFANLAPYWEKESCLELKKNYLQKACECSKRGLTFSADEALQDQTLEAFTAVQKLEKKARDRGIRNPIINKIVTEAAGVRDCFNIGTMESLRKTGKTLESIVGP